MTASPLVSIIMPVKNGGELLRPCMESILNQTYNKWQLLVIDDHSTDATSSTLHSYAESEPRIHILENEGIGIIPALQMGYRYAMGQYITRMDADDIMPEQKLEILTHLLQSAGRGHVATGHVAYFSDEKEIGNGYKSYQHWLNNLCNNDSHWSDVYRECVIPSPCWMMHKDDFDGIGAFSENRYPEDYDLCFRMYADDIRVVSSSTVLHHWRDHSVRASRTDPNYADNLFLSLKMHYFIDIEVPKYDLILLVGAGRKGKTIARKLKEHGISFEWFTNNERKVGVNIGGTIIKDYKTIRTHLHGSFCVIGAIANKEDQKNLVNTMSPNMIGDLYLFA